LVYLQGPSPLAFGQNRTVGEDPGVVEAAEDVIELARDGVRPERGVKLRASKSISDIVYLGTESDLWVAC
jgi:hypothetical protein